MKPRLSHGVLLTLLAIIFAIGLTFASVELPGLVDSFLHQKFKFPDVATVSKNFAERDPIGSTYKTELYLQHYHFRLIGYMCLALIIILIVVGFITNKSGFSSAGAIVLFLPVFGHFALTMFFLGGLGFLRLIWMPFLDVSYDVLHLGDIVYLPYKILLYVASFLGINIWKELPYAITGIGLLLFMLGTLAWFYARIQKKSIADFWVYRISRHPQYLGWIIWSYGVLFLPGSNIKKMFDISNSLPWLLSTMVIIGVAMLEELRMKRERGEEYESYCRRTPFLFPIPRIVSRIISTPMRFILKKDRPEKKREIAGVIALYTAICIVLSVCYVNFPSIATIKPQTSPANAEQSVDELVEAFKKAERRGADQYAISLAALGEPGVEKLIELLQDETPHIREFSAMALGNVQAKQAVPSLLPVLHDEQWRVRQAALSALVEIQPDEAMKYLVPAMSDEALAVRYSAAEELGNIGTEPATNALISHLNDKNGFVRMAIVNALGSIHSERVVEPLIEALQDESERVRRASVLALSKIKSERAVAALTEAMQDEDWEVRLYAAEALKRNR